ncbi:MAG: ABC transporter permease [Phycisphaeraceae bacterium]|nr:ABC transporter permease [Phycisphaeraceae bacterium]MBX3408433.1 ABC transporter permease [Phycisphaeraceae bacterium]
MTFLLETIRLGLSNLRLRLLRSILTALGIVFGVAAVIIMSSLGEGAKRDALARIEVLGARNIIARSQKPPETQNQQSGQRQAWLSRFGITRADFEVIRENFPDVEAIVPLKEVGGQVLRGAIRKTSQAFGTTPDLPRVANLRMERGRYLAESDMQQRAMVAVIGSEIAKQFFPLEDPVGQTLRIDTRVFTVIGVLAPIGLAGGAGGALIGRDLNLDIHIPLTTARETFGDLVVRGQSGAFQANETQVSEVYIMVRDRETVISASQLLRRIMEVRHPGMPDVNIIVPYELLENARKTQLTYNLVFGAVAGISLLVGGIGIMNIMLASVTERTREIGIRRAIGATRKHILWQFLVETSVLSAIGGLLGVALGVGGSVVVDWLVPRLPSMPLIGQFFQMDAALPTHVTAWSIIISFGVATVTGLVFGIYPALRASQQDPIESLRHD